MEELAVERKPLETGVVGAENIKVNGAIDWLKKLREDCKRRQKIELESVQRWEELNRRRKKEEEETIRFINEMQEQEEAEREIRRQRVEEGNPTNCDICLEKIEAKDLLPLDRCGHLFHPACLRQYFETEIGFRRLPLVCPLCRIEVSVMDIKDFLTADGQAKWEEYTFKKAVESNPDNFSFCPTPDCSYVFVWDPSDTSDFTCPTCAKRYCLNCRCAFHTDQSCKEYQISSKFTVSEHGNRIGRGQAVCELCEGDEVQAVPQMPLLGREEPGAFPLTVGLRPHDLQVRNAVLLPLRRRLPQLLLQAGKSPTARSSPAASAG
eukprot:TRINITY_DN10614_c0_g1_i5.p1 TRINITY_DN10614_c0_g1~~TRINITY_DN10614_c0_g1_i5.p1  ORF type:complete len:322 (+),score=57.50 TRINITY_DN10614_c0_g1_i5:487-1452(+)